MENTGLLSSRWSLRWKVLLAFAAFGAFITAATAIYNLISGKVGPAREAPWLLFRICFVVNLPAMKLASAFGIESALGWRFWLFSIVVNTFLCLGIGSLLVFSWVLFPSEPAESHEEKH